ncbi:hypothetical protein ACJJTC_006910 [Scirpophaga incertulas]
MSILHACGTCCQVLSIWAVIQLVVMGIFYKFEITQLLEDVEEEHYEGILDYIKKTKSNYQACAKNCWIAAAIYFVMIIISRLCIMKAKKSAELAAAKKADDELFCAQKAAISP